MIVPLHCFSAEILRWGWSTRKVAQKFRLSKSRGTVCSFQSHYNLCLYFLQNPWLLFTIHNGELRDNIREILNWVSITLLWEFWKCNSVQRLRLWFVLNKSQFKINIEWITYIQSQLQRMCTKLQIHTIVAYYAPVRGDNGRTRDEFCEKLCNVMNKCNPGEKIILLGNTNEWVQIM